MECDTCLRMRDVSDDMLCVTCARSSVYLARLELARSLLEKEKLEEQIQAIIKPFSIGAPLKDDIRDAQQAWEVEKAQAEMAAIKAGIQDTKSSIDTMKEEKQRLRKEIEERRERIAARKQNLQTIMNVVPARQQNTMTDISHINDELDKLFHNTHNRSTKTKAFLCGELASLLRLKQKKSLRNGTRKEVYSLAGMIVPNLREINNIRCTDLSATLTNFSHLLVQISFYLGVRLPAEITSPHRDYPLPTINTPANSFLGREVAFPGPGSTGLTSNSLTSTGIVPASFRPRPLFIGSDDLEEKVAQFAKRDPPAFNLFVEGVSLLAWNVAWLNRSQGFSAGTTTWEDICDIGRSVWQLTQTPAQSPALLRVLSARDAKAQAKSQDQSDTTQTVANTGVNSLGRLGQASHLSAHSYLGASTHAEQMRTWKVDRWNIVSDSLKKHLVTEMNNAEWEILQEQEWEDGGEQLGEAVVIQPRKSDNNEQADKHQDETANETLIDPEILQTALDPQIKDDNKPRRLSGWTKLKNRDKESKAQDKGKAKELKSQDKEARELDKSITKTRDKDGHHDSGWEAANTSAP